MASGGCGGTGEFNGCPATVWDGPYSFRCGLGGDGTKCARHGDFSKEPCPGCDDCRDEPAPAEGTPCANCGSPFGYPPAGPCPGHPVAEGSPTPNKSNDPQAVGGGAGGTRERRWVLECVEYDDDGNADVWLVVDAPRAEPGERVTVSEALSDPPRKTDGHGARDVQPRAEEDCPACGVPADVRDRVNRERVALADAEAYLARADSGEVARLKEIAQEAQATARAAGARAEEAEAEVERLRAENERLRALYENAVGHRERFGWTINHLLEGEEALRTVEANNEELRSQLEAFSTALEGLVDFIDAVPSEGPFTRVVFTDTTAELIRARDALASLGTGNESTNVGLALAFREALDACAFVIASYLEGSASREDLIEAEAVARKALGTGEGQ